MLFQDLENDIKQAYENGGKTPDEAEALAAKFLHAQMQISSELKRAQLDMRMKKSGNKAIRAAVYLDTIKKAEKRPTEAQAAAMVDSDSIVLEEQNRFDEAEVLAAELERQFNICENGHIFMRGVAKGSFGA